MITKGMPQPGVYTWCVEQPQFSGFYIPPASEYKLQESFSLPASVQNALRAICIAIWWLVFGLLFTSLIGVWKMPAEKFPLGVLSALLVACGLLTLLHISGLVPLAWERRGIEPEKIQHREGSYTPTLPATIASATRTTGITRRTYMRTGFCFISRMRVSRSSRNLGGEVIS